MSLSSLSKKSGCSESLSELEELGLRGEEGETGRSGEGREASELSNAQEMMKGDVGVDGARTVKEEDRGVRVNGGVGGAGIQEEPGTCLLGF